MRMPKRQSRFIPVFFGSLLLALARRRAILRKARVGDGDIAQQLVWIIVTAKPALPVDTHDADKARYLLPTVELTGKQWADQAFSPQALLGQHQTRSQLLADLVPEVA